MKCLAIGLQDTGKTSYITAFWAIEKDGNTKHKLTFDKYPSDTSYLDSSYIVAGPSGCTTQPNQYYRPNFRLDSYGVWA